MYEGAIQELIDELGRLPGVGPKSAQRIAFHILQSESVDIQRLVEAIREVKERVKFCEICGNVSEDVQCRICRDPKRELHAICVVEESKDVQAIEDPSSAVAITSLVAPSVRLKVSAQRIYGSKS